MTSPRRNNGGEPRPSRALDAQSISSRCQKDWEEGKRYGKSPGKTWRLRRRRERNSCLCVFVFSSLSPRVPLSFCICFMSLLLCPRHYYLFFISSFSDISPSGFIILTVSLLSVRHEESGEGSADFTNFFFLTSLIYCLSTHIYIICVCIVGWLQMGQERFSKMSRERTQNKYY